MYVQKNFTVRGVMRFAGSY